MKKAFVFALIASVSLIVASCASAPAKPPETPPETPQVTPPETPAPLPEAELAKAKELKQKADTYQLGDYAPEEYAAGTSSLKAGEDTYGKDNVASKKSLDQAVASFTTVIDKGGTAYIGKARDEADASRKSADDLKASVAVKDDYGKAQDAYDKAGKEAAAGDLGNAGTGYASARDGFNAAAASAQEKKDRATHALDDTNQAMSASEKNAEEAEKSLQAEGFTASGAQ
jgi:hypothetical protein